MCFNIVQQEGSGYANKGRDKTSLDMSKKLLNLEHGYTRVTKN